jgi:hypothetical protein
LPYQEIDVPLLGQAPRFWQVFGQGLYFREWHFVQLIPISKLESVQSQSRDSGEQ